MAKKKSGGGRRPKFNPVAVADTSQVRYVKRKRKGTDSRKK